MLRGINYCSKRSLYSANDLKDTLEYFSHKQPEPMIRVVSIPVKYKMVIAQERPIEVYSRIYSGVKIDE